jgi:rhodanese-related sulfurtransferase
MNPLRSIIKQAFVIVIFSFLAGLAVNVFHPRGYVMVGSSRMKEKKIVYITADEAKIKHDGGAALFVDSRSPGEYNGGHADGAVNIPSHPASIMMRGIEENMSLINGPRELVIYCSAHACDSSDVLAGEIAGLGYSRHIYIIEKGFPEWSDSGYPVSSSK